MKVFDKWIVISIYWERVLVGFENFGMYLFDFDFYVLI